MCVCVFTYMSVSVFTHIRVSVRVCTDCMDSVELQVHFNKPRFESLCTKTCKTNRKDCFLVKKKKKQKVKQFLEIFAQKLDTASKKRSNMPVYLIWSVKHTKSAQKERLFFLFVFIFATCFWQSIDRPDTVILAGVDCVTDSPQVCSCEGLFAYDLWGRVTSRVHQRRNVVIKVT